MVITMTNRLLGIVIALALTSGVVAHAAQAPQRPIAPLTLAATLQTAASHVSETATGAIDPAAAIRAAYQRNHVALEHLRQQASMLKGTAHVAFNQFVSDQELALTQTEGGTCDHTARGGKRDRGHGRAVRGGRGGTQPPTRAGQRVSLEQRQAGRTGPVRKSRRVTRNDD